MQNLALISGVVSVLSLGLIDTHIDKNLFRIGKIVLGPAAESSLTSSLGRLVTERRNRPMLC